MDRTSKRNRTGASVGEALNEEIKRMQDNGFTGQRGWIAHVTSSGHHHLSIAEYEFPDGSVEMYVEATETHDGPARSRVMALSTVVHLMQNVGRDEAFQIGNREPIPAPESEGNHE